MKLLIALMGALAFGAAVVLSSELVQPHLEQRQAAAPTLNIIQSIICQVNCGPTATDRVTVTAPTLATVYTTVYTATVTQPPYAISTNTVTIDMRYTTVTIPMGTATVTATQTATVTKGTTVSQATTVTVTKTATGGTVTTTTTEVVPTTKVTTKTATVTTKATVSSTHLDRYSGGTLHFNCCRQHLGEAPHPCYHHPRASYLHPAANNQHYL
ncbi:hypothetical protein IWQ60_002517 [Tieghemiomyces parasiticus]|uniref:Uncharacterized protein n=1 Tax=Tieghemiomyces parasiticus TaxID=78921 RepID=A0A9W8AJC9_9FUNG|nr:hypothetical protein IWQ60_002517 [Tieghemiomyces parasiticus]